MIAESEIQRLKNVGGVSYAPVPRKRKELGERDLAAVE